MPLLFIAITLLAMPGWLLPNNSPISELLFPGFIALYICLIFPRRKEHFKEFGVHKLGTLKAYAPVLLLVVASILTYALPALFGLASAGLIGQLGHVIAFIPLAIYEEIGWRGYLQGELTKRIGPRTAVFAVGVIWAIWHFGQLFTGQLFSSGNFAVNAILFIISALLISVVLGFSRYVSGSVWPAIVGHAAINYVQEIGNAMFANASSIFTYVSGAVSFVLLAALAWYYWKKLPLAEPATQQ